MMEQDANTRMMEQDANTRDCAGRKERLDECQRQCYTKREEHKDIKGSWHPRSFYGNERIGNSVRSECATDFRLRAKPRPPERFLWAMKNVPSGDLFFSKPAAHTSIGRGEYKKDFLAWHAPGGAGSEYHPVTSHQVSYDPNEDQKFCTKKKLVRAENQCHGDFVPYESTYQRDLCCRKEFDDRDKELNANFRFHRMQDGWRDFRAQNDSVASSLSWSRPAEKKVEEGQFSDCDEVHREFYH